MNPGGKRRSSSELRADIYAGERQLFALPEAKTLALAAKEILLESLDVPDLRRPYEQLSPGELFQRVGKARREVFESRELARLSEGLLAALGFEGEALHYEAPRLRGVFHEGHLIPAAAPVYYAHRDTWYSVPRQSINLWLPLHDVMEAETFRFFPDAFAKPVDNDSERFDFGIWEQDRALRVGWQKPGASNKAPYPRALETLGEEWGFSAGFGEVLTFSGAHLHQTREQSLGTARFSIDLRVVHTQDHLTGDGPSNMDNRSTGSALSSYIPLPSGWSASAVS